MKRTVCAFLSLLSVLLCLGTYSFAAQSGRVSVSGVPEKPIQGMRFTAMVELNRNPGLVYLCTTVTFDPKVLEVVDVQDMGLLPSFVMSNRASAGKIELQWRNEKNVDLTASGNLAKINFIIRDDAPYGESEIVPQVSQRYVDARNAEGKSVEFQVSAGKVNLVCPHADTETVALAPPTFDQAGLGEVTCRVCGEKWQREILPSVLSSDEKTTLFVSPGTFSETDEKGVRTDYLYGGDFVQRAKEIFGDDLIRSFRVSVTKNRGNFVPEGKAQVELQTEFDLPRDFVLYVMGEEVKKADFEYFDGILSFDYQNAVFVLVSREREIPATTARPSVTPTTFAMPSETRSPEKEARLKDSLLLGFGLLACVLFGGAAVFLLRKGKR